MALIKPALKFGMLFCHLLIFFQNLFFSNTVKPVLSCHLKIDKTKVLMENGSLMKVESIAEYF